MALEGGPMTVFVLCRAAPVGDYTSEFLECFTSLAKAQQFLFQTKPMLPPEQYEWRPAPFDADRWQLVDAAAHQTTDWTIVAKRLISHG